MVSNCLRHQTNAVSGTCTLKIVDQLSMLKLTTNTVMCFFFLQSDCFQDSIRCDFTEISMELS